MISFGILSMLVKTASLYSDFGPIGIDILGVYEAPEYWKICSGKKLGSAETLD